jgi:D-alanine-D-alanine ligase-like ATP-grasp enzyme
VDRTADLRIANATLSELSDLSDTPTSNLHLGNRRASLTGLDAPLAAARQLAEHAAACFPHSLYAGVDILLDARGRAYVGEINAFGDLLPGVLHQSKDAYSAIATAYFGRCAPSPSGRGGRGPR